MCGKTNYFPFFIVHLNDPFFQVNVDSKTVLSAGGHWQRYVGSIPKVYNPINALDLNNITQLIDKFASQIPTNEPWNAARALEWDSMTAQQFIDAYCWTHFAKSMIRVFLSNILCVEPGEVSLLFLLWYIASGEGVDRLANVTNGAQEAKLVGGMQQVSDLMADDLDDAVRLNQVAVSVNEDETGEITVTTRDDMMYTGTHVICAIPQVLLNQITFSPPLQPSKLQLINGMPMGCVIKTVMFYKDAFWRSRGLNGQAVSEQGPVLYCVDDTKPDGSHPAIMGFVLADHARKLMSLTSEERRDAIAKHYARLFRCDDFLHPVNYVEKNWTEEEFSGGCYTCAMPPGVLTHYGESLRTPHGRVYWAGTESATHWAGYVEGAIEAGERAAAEVLADVGKSAPTQVSPDDRAQVNRFTPPTRPLVERVLPSVGTFINISALLAVVIASSVYYYLTC